MERRCKPCMDLMLKSESSKQKAHSFKTVFYFFVCFLPFPFPPPRHGFLSLKSRCFWGRNRSLQSPPAQLKQPGNPLPLLLFPILGTWPLSLQKALCLVALRKEHLGELLSFLWLQIYLSPTLMACWILLFWRSSQPGFSVVWGYLPRLALFRIPFLCYKWVG